MNPLNTNYVPSDPIGPMPSGFDPSTGIPISASSSPSMSLPQMTPTEAPIPQGELPPLSVDSLEAAPTELPATPEPPATLPEWNTPPASSNNGGLKKQLLQKLMSNLLNKPGRSMHELITGVKDAIGAYKNYAKEWDSLSGLSDSSTGTPTSGTGAPGGNKVQDILKSIQSKKAPTVDGSGGPGSTINTSSSPQQIPQQIPSEPLIAVPQSFDFNRPAPTNSLGIWGH